MILSKTYTRRRFLKASSVLTGLSVFSGWVGNSVAASTIGLAGSHPATATTGNNQVSQFQNLTVNININREDLDDWVLIENLTEQPITLHRFKPRFVNYNDKELDLDALLSRQQRGKRSVEIWPNHAWSHSLKGATSGDTSPTIKQADSRLVRSVQLPCYVDDDGIVHLI